jgi:hypothetical protein
MHLERGAEQGRRRPANIVFDNDRVRLLELGFSGLTDQAGSYRFGRSL